MAEGAILGELAASVCSKDLFDAHSHSKKNSKLTASRGLPFREQVREQARHPVARQPSRETQPQWRALGV